MGTSATWPPAFEQVVRANLGLGQSTTLLEDTRLPDFGLDSLTAVNLSMDLEETFGVVFPDTALIAATFTTAGTLWQTVDKLGPIRATGGTADADR
jgi:acyl carrier protein